MSPFHWMLLFAFTGTFLLNIAKHFRAERAAAKAELREARES